MPKQIADIKKFLVYAKRKDARGNTYTTLHNKPPFFLVLPTFFQLKIEIRVKKNTNETKFKLRCSKYLYTLKVADAKKAEKLRKSFPSSKQSYHIVPLMFFMSLSFL